MALHCMHCVVQSFDDSDLGFKSAGSFSFREQFAAPTVTMVKYLNRIASSHFRGNRIKMDVDAHFQLIRLFRSTEPAVRRRIYHLPR